MDRGNSNGLAEATYDLDYEPQRTDFVLGGYDAKTCPEAVNKKYHPNYADVVRDDFTPGDLGRMEAGNVREQKVISDWMAAMEPWEIVKIPDCDRSVESRRRRAEMTMKIMNDPGTVRVIVNARLPQLWATHRTGEPDALLLDGRRADGTPVWLPVDMKDHKSLEGTRKNLTWPVSSYAKPDYSAAVPTALYPGIPQKVDAFQLAHYHRMLETLGFASDRPRGAIIGRESVLVWHDLSQALYGSRDSNGNSVKVSALDYYDKEFAYRVDVAVNAKQGISITSPEWKPECQGCPFRTVCHDELKFELDHITLLPGITPTRARAHYNNGIKTVAALSRLHHPTALLVDAGVNVTDLMSKALLVDPTTAAMDLLVKSNDLMAAAFLAANINTAKDVLDLDEFTAQYSATGVWELANSIDQARVTKVGKVHRPRGVDAVSIPRARIEEDIDIEDAPNPNGGGTLVYMIGVRDAGYSERDGENVQTRTEYHCFADYSGTEEGERKVFADFWAHITYMRQHARMRKYGYRAFHYTKHEDHAFRSLAIKHAGKPGIPPLSEVEEFLGSKSWVDLYPLVSNQLIWPTESVTLKDTAKWVRFNWRDSDPGGGNSITWYRDAVGHADPKVREENRKRLSEYNADDCHAQLKIRDWLSRFGETRQPGARLPGVATLDRRFQRRVNRTNTTEK